METTLAIDDDILAAAQELAASEQKSVGEVISSLARRALHPAEARWKTRNGVPVLERREGSGPVTPELVSQLSDELRIP